MEQPRTIWAFSGKAFARIVANVVFNSKKAPLEGDYPRLVRYTPTNRVLSSIAMELSQLAGPLTIGIVLLSWRTIHSQLTKLSSTVADIDRRLARVEGALSVKIPLDNLSDTAPS